MAKITIFGLAGTGKTTAGKMLAEKLGYAYMSTGNIFRAYATDLGMTLAELEEASELTDIHDKKLDMNTAEYGKTHDNFVFESRLAWHFIPDSFKIKLSCEFHERVSRVANREGKSFEDAKNETLHREGLITGRYQKYYGIVDFNADTNFDLIVDTQTNDAERVVELILGELRAREIL